MAPLVHNFSKNHWRSSHHFSVLQPTDFQQILVDYTGDTTEDFTCKRLKYVRECEKELKFFLLEYNYCKDERIKKLFLCFNKNIYTKLNGPWLSEMCFNFANDWKQWLPDNNSDIIIFCCLPL